MRKDREIVVTVVVCTFNRATMLSCCLSSLVAQSLSNDQYEIVVVDNGSEDNTQELVASFVSHYDNIRCVVEKESGLSNARNRGWQETRGEYIAFIDDDAWATSDWLQRVDCVIQTIMPRPDILCGEIRPFYLCRKPAWFIDEYEIRAWGHQARFLVPEEAVDAVHGSNMFFRKEILAAHNGFSHCLGMQGKCLGFGEETAFMLGIRDCGYQVWYDPALQVRHAVTPDSRYISRRGQRWFLSTVVATRLRREPATWRKRIETAGLIAIHALLLPGRILCGGRFWQRTLLARVCQIAALAGRLYAMCTVDGMPYGERKRSNS